MGCVAAPDLMAMQSVIHRLSCSVLETVLTHSACHSTVGSCCAWWLGQSVTIS